MAELRQIDDRFEACCEICCRWQEVAPRQLSHNIFFLHFEAEFRCCGKIQVATLTVENDEIDVH